MPEALFNIARYLYHELLKDEPKGELVMNVFILVFKDYKYPFQHDYLKKTIKHM